MRTALAFFSTLAIYGLLVLTAAFWMPLHLGEITQAAAFLHFEWQSFFTWIAQTPAGAPLHYLFETPFALAAPGFKPLLRIPSFLAAIGSVFLFHALAKKVPLQYPLLALILFLVIPVHLMYATQARPYELALFWLLAATLAFFSLTDQPSLVRAAIYALLLTAAIYTQPSAYLPSIGYALALVGFASVKNYRRALWYALAATVVPLVAYGPYDLWASGQRHTDWLTEQFPALSVKMAGVQAMMGLDPGSDPWFGIALCSIFTAGLIGGIVSVLPLAAHHVGMPPPPAPLLRRRAIVFSLACGALVAVLGQAAVCGWTLEAFSPYQIMWALPGFAIVLCAALDAAVRMPILRSLKLGAPIVVGVAIALCIPGDLEYLATQPPDVAKLTALVRPQFNADSCVVFVSQRLSRYIFSVYDPELAKFECQNFFHSRVVLAIHPYVRPDQEREARIFFLGLDFEETHRDIVNPGKVITMDSKK